MARLRHITILMRLSCYDAILAQSCDQAFFAVRPDFFSRFSLAPTRWYPIASLGEEGWEAVMSRCWGGAVRDPLLVFYSINFNCDFKLSESNLNHD